MIAAIKRLLAGRAAAKAKREHDKRWPIEHQLEWLRATVANDHQWLGHNPVAAELCKRYRTMLRDDWEKQSVEDVSNLRTRLDLDPHSKRRPTPTDAGQREGGE